MKIIECTFFHDNPILDVSKVSTRFEYFASEFAALLVLMLNDVVLGAEFYGESNGVRVEGGCRA